jgi:hypothetical protein
LISKSTKSSTLTRGWAFFYVSINIIASLDIPSLLAVHLSVY